MRNEHYPQTLDPCHTHKNHHPQNLLAQPCILGERQMLLVEANHNAYRHHCLLYAPTEPVSRPHSMYLE